ncbi:unnamed protein product [Caenorhabditis brenneri]
MRQRQRSRALASDFSMWGSCAAKKSPWIRTSKEISATRIRVNRMDGSGRERGMHFPIDVAAALPASSTEAIAARSASIPGNALWQFCRAKPDKFADHIRHQDKDLGVTTMRSSLAQAVRRIQMEGRRLWSPSDSFKVLPLRFKQRTSQEKTIDEKAPMTSVLGASKTFVGGEDLQSIFFGGKIRRAQTRSNSEKLSTYQHQEDDRSSITMSRGQQLRKLTIEEHRPIGRCSMETTSGTRSFS